MTRSDILVKHPTRVCSIRHNCFSVRPTRAYSTGANTHDGTPWLSPADVETGNAFETQLVKISNNPFTRPKFAEGDPQSSPKIMKLVQNVEDKG